MTLNITSANAVYMITAPPLYPTPQQLQGWGVAEAFDTEQAEAAEVQIGVDGFVASGWLPRITRQTLTFLAASPSIDIFEQITMAQDQLRQNFSLTGMVTILATSRKYNLLDGTLTRIQALPNARRVLDPRRFEIIWGFPITVAPA
jgi:Tail fiber protein gp32